MRNKYSIFSLLLLSCSHTSIAGDDLLYTDYLDIIEDNHFHNYTLYFSNKEIPIERVINIAISQANKVDSSNVNVYINNLDILLERNDIGDYRSLISRLRFYSLVRTGNYQDAILIKDATTDNNNKLAIILTYMKAGRVDNALRLINSIDNKDYISNRDDYIELAKKLVIDYDIESIRIKLPKNGNILLSSILINEFEDNAMYKSAFDELNNKLLLLDVKVEKLAALSRMVLLSEEHNLSDIDTFSSMMNYINLSNSLDIKDINDNIAANIDYYTNSITDAYLDKNLRKILGIKRSEILKAQEKISASDVKYKINYFTNQIKLNSELNNDIYYNSINQLALLKKDEKILVGAYDDKLKIATKKMLLKSYFDINSGNSDQTNNLFMAAKFEPYLNKCTDIKNNLLKVIKSHKLYEYKDVNSAYQCIKNIDYSLLNIPVISKNKFIKEKYFIEFDYLKEDNNFEGMLKIVQNSNDMDLKLEYFDRYIRFNNLDKKRIDKIDSLVKNFDISIKDKETINRLIVDRLKDSRHEDLLKERLLLDKEKYIHELILLAIKNDEIQSAIADIIYMFNKNVNYDNEQLNRYIRYIDSHFSNMSIENKEKLNKLQNINTISVVYSLNKVESNMNDYFSDLEGDVIENISQYIDVFDSVNGFIDNLDIEEPNIPAYLYVKSKLYYIFSLKLEELAENVDSNVKEVLLEKANMYKSESRDFLIQTIQNRITDNDDKRILSSVKLLEKIQ
ncbi:hypothetical protein [Photobacterium damselae]|uniref:hypothetical protein n=1 Tax=Photobacterium damselae TaxID=38293 RepID=UPI0040680794